MALCLISDPESDYRLRSRCNRRSLDYPCINDMLARMLFFGPKIDSDPDYKPELLPGENDYEEKASWAAVNILKELAVEYDLTHRETALMARDNWIGPGAAFPEEYRGNGLNMPITIDGVDGLEP